MRTFWFSNPDCLIQQETELGFSTREPKLYPSSLDYIKKISMEPRFYSEYIQQGRSSLRDGNVLYIEITNELSEWGEVTRAVG